VKWTELKAEHFYRVKVKDLNATYLVIFVFRNLLNEPEQLISFCSWKYNFTGFEYLGIINEENINPNYLEEYYEVVLDLTDKIESLPVNLSGSDLMDMWRTRFPEKEEVGTLEIKGVRHEDGLEYPYSSVTYKINGVLVGDNFELPVPVGTYKIVKVKEKK